MTIYSYIHLILGLIAAYLTTQYILYPPKKDKYTSTYIGCLFLGPVALILVSVVLIYMYYKAKPKDRE